MSEHRRAHDVADRKDVRLIGAHLPVDRDESTLAQLHAGGFDADAGAVRGSPDTHQHSIVGRNLGRAAASKGYLQPFAPGLYGGDPGARPHVFVSARDPFLERLDEVAIATWHQTLGELDDADLDTERLVNGRHLEADDAAADNQQAPGQVELERAGRIDDSWIVGQPGQAGGLGTRRDDALRKAHRSCITPFGNAHLVRTGKLARALDHRDLALPGKPGEASGQPIDHAALPLTQAADVDRRLAEADAVRSHLARFFDDTRRMQQRLRRDAADVQTHTAELGPAFDQCDLET